MSQTVQVDPVAVAVDIKKAIMIGPMFEFEHRMNQVFKKHFGASWNDQPVILDELEKAKESIVESAAEMFLLIEEFAAAGSDPKRLAYLCTKASELLRVIRKA